MKNKRRSMTAVVGPILLSAAAIGIVILRRKEETQDPAKLPENSPKQEELAMWAGRNGLTRRGEDAVVAMRTAGTRGLRPEDYAKGLDETDPVKRDAAIGANLKRFAMDLRNGHANQGLYKAPAPTPEAVLDTITNDPQGIEAGLQKLDPPFAEYRRLLDALAKYREMPGEEQHVAQIERTLERWRWLPREFPNGVIVVNVPEFQLRAYDGQMQQALQMKVVVGQLRHTTPLFMGQLKYLVFGPYWHVPASILANEIVPDIEKDRTYLTRNNYEVTNGAGEVVGGADKVSEEVLKGLKSGDYHLRQIPGARNALGRVKFMFPNQENVYLHDTNARKLFARETRAFSHGCVRVEQPEELAKWVLRDQPAWTAERIAKSLTTTKQEQANLKKPIPVLIVYHTVTVDESGTVHFLPDIYGRESF